MRKICRLACTLCVLAIGFPAMAQKKSFTYEQVFQGAPVNAYRQLPDIRGWADDEHYIEWQKSADGQGSLISVDARTGQSAPFRNSMPENTGKNEGENRNITESPDAKWQAYTKKDNNLYVRELATQKETRLSSDGSDSVLNGYASWVYYEEILGRQSYYRAFWWSPDSRHICYMHFNESGVPVFPIYWAAGQHGFLENQRYPKAGDKNPEVKIGVANVATGATVWADFNEKDDQYFGPPQWTPGGQLWVQWMNRGQDRLKVYAIDEKGGKKEVYEEKQATWINLHEGRRFDFTSDGKTVIIKSDKDGWENLYRYSIEGKLLNPVISGNFWGTSVIKIDNKTQTLYFQARKETSARFDFYKVGLNGKGLTRLSFGNFTHDQIYLSPSAKYFITTYSNLSAPPVTALVDAGNGRLIRQLGSAKGSEFDSYNMPVTEMVRVKSDDGLFDLPVVITYPVHFDPSKKYPILISIYGGPNAGTVYDRWRNTGAALWWAQEGLVQVSMDNRASGHFGRRGMNFIHRQLGKYEIEDFITCTKWLRSRAWADTSRVCITGGSFGGYMTCMALTYGAGIFNYGVANSSVTNWALYDTHYTERYMDSPQENPEGYRSTSPLAYAGRYKGLLRIVHGTIDDNVHMQNSIQLIDTLEDLKKHFELMLYPGERHGIGGRDQLKGLHNRTEAYEFYYKNLLNKPMPQAFLL